MTEFKQWKVEAENSDAREAGPGNAQRNFTGFNIGMC